MPLYRAYGLNLHSEMELPELPRVRGASDLEFRVSECPFGRVRQWFHKWTQPSGAVWLLLGRIGRDYLMRFPDLADFFISQDARTVCCYSKRAIAASTVRHLLLDQVLPAALSQRGRLVLHAGAVVLPAGVVAFLGRTGQGKSTLTASLCMEGYPLITDDCLLIEDDHDGPFCVPSYPGLRLWEDSASRFVQEPAMLPKVAHYSEKYRLSDSKLVLWRSEKPARLRRLYLLDLVEDRSAHEVRIRPISPTVAVMKLLEYSFRLDLQDSNLLRKEFTRLTSLVARHLVYQLSYPREFSSLALVSQAILKHTAADSNQVTASIFSSPSPAESL